jgi:DNA polymerase-3 subunit delta'
MSLPGEPRTNPELLGHEGAALTLAESAASGRLHHAWLIAGPQGIGKTTLAYRFARWLLAGMPPATPPLHLAPSHPTFRRIAAGAHPDLHTIEPNAGEKGVKRMIRAEDARSAIRFMAHTAAEGGWRVVIMDSPEAAGREAPNILLKTLEEPPPRAVLLLTSAAPDRLLPTIRSRCRRLDLAPLPEPAMENLLARWLPDLDPTQRATLRRIAEGSPGQALRLADGEGLAMQTLVEEALAALPRLDPRRAIDLAERIAAARDGSGFVTFMALLRRALAAACRDAARGAAAPSWLAARSLADWSALWDRLGRLAEEADRLNLDRKQAVLTGLGWLAPR